MKLQNFMVLFIIIVLPIIIVASYYMTLQIDTINMQTSYNSKLLEATKQAIEAYEINTVEWNGNEYNTSDAKRRYIMASINTFVNSFGNNIGIGGVNKETILTYVPAIAYTLYDGYYIYTPANNKITIKDENEVTVTMKKSITEGPNIKTENYLYKEADEGKILYEVKENFEEDGKYQGKEFTLDSSKAKSEYKHILKPFSAYARSYKDKKGNDIIINYTLDNFITLYGKINGNYGFKSGYLINIQQVSYLSNTISDLKYKYKKIEPEQLSENIAYYTNYNSQVEEYKSNVPYIYSSNYTKVYIDGSEPFIIDPKGKRIDINTSNIEYYKKCSIPDGVNGYKEIYQDLKSGAWYEKQNNSIEISESNRSQISEETLSGYFVNFQYFQEKIYDFSAINYFVESYSFTKFVSDLEIQNSKGEKILNIDNSNDSEVETSLFNSEKREVIKEALVSDLNQAITSYSSNVEGEYELPKLLETDWDYIVNNVSIITFMQNIPIGIKYYNNYAIAVSTLNREYVDPDEIYLNGENDEYYHRLYCEKLTASTITGYRNTDYVLKSYNATDENGNKICNYYYPHNNNSYALQKCYYCMIQRDLYKKIVDLEKKENQEKAYYTSLGRERYVRPRTS